MQPDISDQEVPRLQGYWRDEVEAVQTYQQLAEAVGDERTRQLLLEMRDASLPQRLPT